MHVMSMHVTSHLATVGLYVELALAFGVGIFIGRWSKR